ncbi:helix-turn-helix domain-containing protein [Bordetella bronchiseptica]|nr:helix-turn-helix domain-containing protein [Bordetella bronchiseptica]
MAFSGLMDHGAQTKAVAVNDAGFRVGQDHPRARYTDGEVAMVHNLRDDGWSYRAIAQKLDMPKSTVRNICRGLQRCQAAVRVKIVLVR